MYAVDHKDDDKHVERGSIKTKISFTFSTLRRMNKSRVLIFERKKKC